MHRILQSLLSNVLQPQASTLEALAALGLGGAPSESAAHTMGTLNCRLFTHVCGTSWFVPWAGDFGIGNMQAIIDRIMQNDPNQVWSAGCQTVVPTLM